MHPRSSSPLALTSLALALALASGPGCLDPQRRYDFLPSDALEPLRASPLLLELPPDPPAPELHAADAALRIGDGTPYTLRFRGAALGGALEEIATRAGVTLLVDEGVSGTVDVDFEDIALGDALQVLLERHGLVLLPGPGNVWFVEREDDPREVTEFFPLYNVRADDVAENLAALVGSGARIITDKDRNLVCLIGRRADASAVRRYLQHVDTLKDQVLLEVHIFEASYEDGFEMGSILDLSDTINGNAFELLSNFAGNGPFSATLTDDKGALDATIDAVRRFVSLELISSPRVLAVTNTQAVVDVVRELPYVEVTATTTGTTGGLGSTVQEQVAFKEAGLKLEITPSIQEAGFLQIGIRQQIIEEVDRFNDIPVVDRRTLDTQFMVKDRETIVLGGLIQSRQSQSRSGVPLLMHVPLLGRLFRGDRDLGRRQEILLFVTPRILSPRQAAELATRYQDSYREARGRLRQPTLRDDLVPGVDGD